MKNLVMLLFTLSLLTACHGSARVQGDGYDVEVDTNRGSDGHRHPAEHCPPGHAKKGWC